LGLPKNFECLGRHYPLGAVHRPKRPQPVVLVGENARTPAAVGRVRTPAFWPSPRRGPRRASRRCPSASCEAAFGLPMNATASTGVVPIAEPAELILEYQRVVARLAQARIITPDEAVRRVRSMKRARARAEQRHEQLAELVFLLVLSLDDGTLKEGEHFMRLADDRVALHPEAAATALYRAQRGRLLRREVQSLLI